MKKSKSIFLVTLAISLSIITSCGSSQSNESTGKMETTNIQTEKDSNILKSYLDIKDALVQSNEQAASKAALKLVNSIPYDQDAPMKKVRDDAQHIANTENIDHQRNHFNALSVNIYKWVKETKVNDQKLYKQYCPMAFNNEGAYWLSAEKKVNNPYFGDKMLHCGSVKEEL